LKGYIGSVRFFKNLILLVVIIAILVPSGFAFHYRGKTAALEEQLVQAKEQYTLAWDGVSELTAQTLAAGETPAASARAESTSSSVPLQSASSRSRPMSFASSARMRAEA